MPIITAVVLKVGKEVIDSHLAENNIICLAEYVAPLWYSREKQQRNLTSFGWNLSFSGNFSPRRRGEFLLSQTKFGFFSSFLYRKHVDVHKQLAAQVF